jgi:hypothetical protein
MVSKARQCRRIELEPRDTGLPGPSKEILTRDVTEMQRARGGCCFYQGLL